MKSTHCLSLFKLGILNEGEISYFCKRHLQVYYFHSEFYCDKYNQNESQALSDSLESILGILHLKNHKAERKCIRPEDLSWSVNTVGCLLSLHYVEWLKVNHSVPQNSNQPFLKHFTQHGRNNKSKQYFFKQFWNVPSFFWFFFSYLISIYPFVPFSVLTICLQWTNFAVFSNL